MPLFLSLISDLFPGLKADKAAHTVVEQAMGVAVSRLARSHPSNQVAIAKVGGIRPLVGMVSSEGPGLDRPRHSSIAEPAAQSDEGGPGAGEAVRHRRAPFPAVQAL